MHADQWKYCSCEDRVDTKKFHLRRRKFSLEIAAMFKHTWLNPIIECNLYRERQSSCKALLAHFWRTRFFFPLGRLLVKILGGSLHLPGECWKSWPPGYFFSITFPDHGGSSGILLCKANLTLPSLLPFTMSGWMSKAQAIISRTCHLINFWMHHFWGSLVPSSHKKAKIGRYQRKGNRYSVWRPKCNGLCKKSPSL